MSNNKNWSLIVPSEVPDATIVKDGEELIYIGKDIEGRMKAKIIVAAPDNLEDNIEWVAIHKALLKSGIKISKELSDRIFKQSIKSKESIEKATGTMKIEFKIWDNKNKCFLYDVKKSFTNKDGKLDAPLLLFPSIHVAEQYVLDKTDIPFSEINVVEHKA